MSRITNRRQRRVRRGIFWTLVAILGGYALLAGDHRPHHLLVLWLEERRTEDRIAELERENERLETQREAFASDPAALERLAREKGMMKPGDMVYRIVRVPPGVREAVAESLEARSSAPVESPPEEAGEGTATVPPGTTGAASSGAVDDAPRGP